MTEASTQLSDSERICLQLAARGESVDAIAGHLDDCPNKVELLFASIRKKLLANTMVEAIARALKMGLIE
ncbi:LuxR C-terminal-related transcriptional regulator [Hoeflea sp. G2-23]|uniref:LuxR C-terminal-related transcriptional regulator n=1 Tax=Hoeflea algicola TaxID=2983763 RepID=A0ABT3Z926_9HYPH|nr:LuxR C-terminal-related transcriptional regulator [Hoeflea algicola]MCY0148229.1 LuxR C-terminal-related transcriptional regulator [Hoeflea algicola]